MNCTIAPSYRLNLVRCLLHGVLFHWYFHSRRWLCIYGTYLDNNSVIFHEKFPNLPGFEPGIFWSVVRRVIHCATGPAIKWPSNSLTLSSFPPKCCIQNNGISLQLNAFVMHTMSYKMLECWQNNLVCETRNSRQFRIRIGRWGISSNGRALA